jgi:hypothetical protein
MVPPSLRPCPEAYLHSSRIWYFVSLHHATKDATIALACSANQFCGSRMLQPPSPPFAMAPARFSQAFQRRTHPVLPAKHPLGPSDRPQHVVNRQPNTTTPLLAAKAPGDMSDTSPMRRTTPVCPYFVLRVSVQASVASPALC